MNMAELEVLMQNEAEEAFDASINCTGRLAFSRQGLRIYEMPNGGHRIFEAPGYNGPHPERYVEVLRERQIEEALVDEYLSMTPEERRKRVTQAQAMADSFNPDLRTAPFAGDRDVEPMTVQPASNGSRPARPRRPTHPTTRATKR